MSEAYLVVGLGNPGPRYSATRHNVGAMALEKFAKNNGEKFKAHKKSGADVIETRVGDSQLIVGLPRVFMNESGRHVGPLAKFYGISPERLIVIHDELDIDFSAVRLKLGGGEGGHNGLRSISATLGTKDYLRIRLGIGRPPGRQDPADFVLTAFSKSEQVGVDLMLTNAIDALELLITAGLTDAQNQVHAW